MSSNLGQSLATHRGTFTSGAVLWYVGAILVASGVVSFVNPPAGYSAADAALIGVAGLVSGAGCLFVAFSRLRQTIEVFEHGFVWSRPMGTKTVMRSDVTEAKVVTVISRKRGASISVVVSLRNGRELKLVGLDKPGQLASLLGPPSGGMSPAAAPGGPIAPGGWKPPGA
jgi:hypothetical protein